MLKFFRFIPSRWWSFRAWRDWADYVHWRLETYGVYYPAGKFNVSAFTSLLRQLPSYHRWLGQIDEQRKRGPAVGP
jgi:hypothetical protein